MSDPNNNNNRLSVSSMDNNGAPRTPVSPSSPIAFPPGVKPTTPSTPATPSGVKPKEKVRPAKLGFIPKANPPAPQTTIVDMLEETGFLSVQGEKIPCTYKDVNVIEELGAGAFGSVKSVIFLPKNMKIAAKQLRDSMKADERSVLVQEVSLIRQCHSPFIVEYYGVTFWEGDIWIFMERMVISLDTFYLAVKEKGVHKTMPEEIIGKIAACVLAGLIYLKDVHRIMHRDVKPSNILMGVDGSIKICDFGISKVMDQSMLDSYRGCQLYLSPERLNPETAKQPYDVRSDVWSYGITLCELALMKYPYQQINVKSDTIFTILTAIVHGEPPKMPTPPFSDSFSSFVAKCLIKNVENRPKYSKRVSDTVPPLIEDSFYQRHFANISNVNVAAWFEANK